MAKAPASDTIMMADKMKPLLALSKRDSVQAAIALTGDGEGLILLDKKAKPKKLMSMLRAEAGKAKLALNAATLRCGRAEVDADYDSSMVRFFINKDAPGNMRAKLVEVVRRAAYQRVEINVDPTIDQEPETDDEALPVDTSATLPPPPPVAPPPDAAAQTRELMALAKRISGAPNQNALATLASEANGHIRSNNPTAAADAIARLHAALESGGSAQAPKVTATSADELRKELMALARRIPEVAGDDATRKAALAELASGANGSLRNNDLAATARTIASLREALGAGTTGEAHGASERWVAARDAWQAASDTVDAQIANLQAALRQQEDPELKEIGEFGLNALTGNNKVRLMALTRELGDGSPLLMRESGAVTVDIIQRFRTHIESSEKIEVCDENPFGVQMSIRTTLGDALAGMQAAIETALKSLPAAA